MATYTYATTTTPANSAVFVSDKVRIATNGATIIVNTNATANTSNSAIIPANSVERDWYVGRGSYISFASLSGNGNVSFTEVGAIPNRTTIAGYYDGPLINPGA